MVGHFTGRSGIRLAALVVAVGAFTLPAGAESAPGELPRALESPKVKVEPALLDASIERLSNGRNEAARLLHRLGFSNRVVSTIESADEFNGTRHRINLDADDYEESIVEVRASSTERFENDVGTTETRRVMRLFVAWLDGSGDLLQVVGNAAFEAFTPTGADETGCALSVAPAHADGMNDTLVECTQSAGGHAATKGWHGTLVTLERGRAEAIFDVDESMRVDQWDKQERTFVVGAGKAPREIRLVAGKGKVVKKRFRFDPKAFRYR